MNEIESVQHSNIAEEEMGSLHAIHFSLNAIAAIQRKMHTGPGRSECIDCADTIPLARRTAARGCIRCLHCQTRFEHH